MATTKESTKFLVRRVAIYLLGMFVLAMGVSFAVKSNLGISPVTSIAYVLTLVTGQNQGVMTTLIYCTYVLLQVLVARKIHVRDLLEVGCAFVFGYFVNLCNHILAFSTPEQYIMRFLLMLCSILLIAVGITLYLSVDLLPQPAEGFILAVQKRSGWAFGNIKMAFDCSVVTIAALISLLGTGTLMGIREGTVFMMLGVGKVIGLISGVVRPKIRPFCGIVDD